MVKMKLKIDDDSNKLKYVSIIRQSNGASIQDIKKNIEDNNVVLECDYFDTDELIDFKQTMEALISKGATVHLFQDNRQVQIDYISNLISSYEHIAEDREKLDDIILRDTYDDVD
ncbi:MAG: hypothetical protein ACI35R_01795 [Bacillus sp. (in: firmicutes)]